MSDLPALLRTGDLAKALGISRHGAAQMIRRGEVPASKLGGQWVVRREALEAKLRRGERHNRKTDSDDAVGRLLRAAPPPRRRGRRST